MSIPPTEPDSAPSEAARSLPRALWGVLAGVLAFHLLWIAVEPPPTYFEDEPHYSRFAHEDALTGDTDLLPGRLRFDQRPELGSRLLSHLVPKDELDRLTRQHVGGDPHLERSARWANLALLLGLLVVLALQARELGLPRRALWLAPLLLGAFPWFGFYVHSLWSEVLHAFLVGLAFLAVFHALRTGRARVLPLGGLALGIALLAKGTMNAFLPVLLAVLATEALLRRRASPLPARLGHTLLAPALFLAGVLAVIGPQLVANHSAGHGWRLAGNRWKNIEMGLVLEPRELQTNAQRLDRARLHQLYMQAGPDYEERERASEERVRAFLEREGIPHVLGGQLRKLGLLLCCTPSFFDRALQERWGEPAPGFFRALAWPARALWGALIVLGLAGAVRFARRGPGFALLGLFVLYYAAAALVIPYKVRFLIQLVPVLALLAAAVLSRPRRPTAQKVGDQSQQP